MTFSFPFDTDKILQASDSLKTYINCDEPFYIIGHRLGDYSRYPTNVNKKKYIPHYKNSTELIDSAFTEYGLNGVELDVRLGSDGNVYVVHDKIKKNLPQESINYLADNSIEKFIQHFIDKKYYLKNRIFIELKLAPKLFHPDKQSFLPDVVNRSEKKLIDNLFRILDRILSQYPEERQLIQQSICFISFSLAALHYAYVVSEAVHEFHLITTTDQFIKKTLSRMMFYVPLTPQEKSRIQYAEWLTGIWFDPYYLDDPVSTFLGINELRRNKLKFYISTYGMKYSKLLEKFKSPNSEQFPVSGMIFDLA
ncbi:hypothetical protein [Leptospira sp. GIMC2001]|uniref:hypothetical protein n=1 Tax=Leptospira sp. GIMC2001 TaxID=1513297 RepID=UPI002349A796|nr:hypothetical protein [Leptospira sp. GIMC2001]WCL49982.1 hypothetical protein O4O04_03955 [Leptospira sp. GIMC2001]